MSVNAEVQGYATRLRLHLDRADAGRLRSLADVVDLAWGTTWEHQAAELVAPRISLEASTWPVAVTRSDDRWIKSPGIMRVAGGRPFAWLDDEARPEDRALLAAYPAPTLLVDVDPHTGLTDEHVAAVRDWATRLSQLTHITTQEEHP